MKKIAFSLEKIIEKRKIYLYLIVLKSLLIFQVPIMRMIIALLGSSIVSVLSRRHFSSHLQRPIQCSGCLVRSYSERLWTVYFFGSSTGFPAPLTDFIASIDQWRFIKTVQGWCIHNFFSVCQCPCTCTVPEWQLLVYIEINDEITKVGQLCTKAHLSTEEVQSFEEDAARKLHLNEPLALRPGDFWIQSPTQS